MSNPESKDGWGALKNTLWGKEIFPGMGVCEARGIFLGVKIGHYISRPG
ncbi:MAG: hypothetical protein JAZ03_10340 [Candidatus Thiodiazotropha taylori]|nr:hypothetical protein [Candidatus Thiodiazotropha taylori]MCG8046214.1 hypothetical protein [Candidatus Thiodiazotropha taylori]MCW4334325.1 hypothetical protein [Candidatus Thiodiazotropha endolucinida]MCW4343919.1 hypothetical protein [Candidatus Thiodiazotropha endolucinida]